MQNTAHSFAPSWLMPLVATQQEYQLTLEIDKDCKQAIQEDLQNFIQSFPQYAGSWLPPQYLPLATFYASERMEETLLRWMERICNIQPQFSIQLNNYGILPPKTVYLRIMDPQLLKAFNAKLRKLDVYLTGCQLPSIHIINHLMLPIASIASTDFNHVLGWFANLEFSQQLLIKRLCLQRKQAGDKRYSNIMNFTLAN